MQQHPTVSIADVTRYVPPFKDSSSSDKAVGMHHYRDHHSLDSTNAVQVYFAAALASQHIQLIRQQNVNILSFYNNFYITPLPITEVSLCCFVTCLGQQGLAHSTICSYFSPSIHQSRTLQSWQKFPQLYMHANFNTHKDEMVDTLFSTLLCS